jgi:hypothetical protein
MARPAWRTQTLILAILFILMNVVPHVYALAPSDPWLQRFWLAGARAARRNDARCIATDLYLDGTSHLHCQRAAYGPREQAWQRCRCVIARGCLRWCRRWLLSAARRCRRHPGVRAENRAGLLPRLLLPLPLA